MTNIPRFIKKMNETNSTNDKIATLTSYKSDTLVQRVLKMTYDKVAYSFGVTMKNVRAGSSENTIELPEALDYLEKLANREFTGNAAIALVEEVLERVSEANRDVVEKILDRDLKINMGRTNINKVIKGLITKPIYMRCDIGTKKNIEKNISFPAIVELKADGTYRECSTTGTSASFISRSGESYSYPLFEDVLKDVEEGYLHGEMTVICDENILKLVLPKMEKADKKNGTNDAETLINNYNEHKANNKEYILPRSLGNGLLNSDKVPYENIVFEVWDFVTPEDYQLAGLKDKKNLPKVPYSERFEKLKNIISNVNSNQIRVIEHKIVNNLKEAYEFTSEKMKEGLEGAILKDFGNVYKDGTSKTQLKLKLEIDAEMRVVGFIEGTPGTKREKTFGALMFENDEGTIKGSTSGFTDEMLEEINNNRSNYIGKVFTIQFNDITKSRGSETYALSHPRFIEFRNDKDTTDTLERCLEMKEMAMNLS